MELKDVIDFTGIKAKDFEEFKTQFESTFVRRDNAHKDEDIVRRTTGKTLDRVSAKIKSTFQKHGIDLSSSDYKDKPIEEVVEAGISGYVETTGATISELEDKVKKNGPELVQAANEKYLKLEEKYKSTKNSLDTLTAEHTNLKIKAENDLKAVRVETIREKEFAKIPIRTDLKPAERDTMLAGFNVMFDKKYIIDFDEENKGYIKSRDKGERIRNPQKANEFLSVEEVLRMEAVEAGISAKNPHVIGNQRVIPIQQNGGPGAQEKTTRPMATRRP